jgi:hypothetical protein
VKWAGYVRVIGNILTATKIVFRGREEKRPLWRLGIDDRITGVLQNVIRTAM